MTVLDLSRLNEIAIREKILTVAVKCNGFQEITTNSDRTVAGLRMSAQNFSDIQRVLRQSAFPVDYIWAEGSQPRLILTPK